MLFYVEHWWCVVLCGALVVCRSMLSTGGVLFYVEHWWCVILCGALVVCRSMWSTVKIPVSLRQDKLIICSPPTDSTLTLSRLTSLLDSVGDWIRLHIWLDISPSKYSDIKKQHSNVTERNKALCEWYLTNHPAPSWRHIAEGLYGAGEHAVLEVLRDQVHYLKGGLL